MKKVIIHALKDIHTVITNKRKVGGAVEAKSIRLRSGEEFTFPVFTSLELTNGHYHSIGFMTTEGEQFLVHVDEISLMRGLEHKLICQLENSSARKYLLTDTIHYLTRLCEVNEGFVTAPFKEEVETLITDISVSELKERGYENTLPFLEENVISLKKSMLA
ncbi:hypothetical protein [Halalkalibacter urbisdiaboli]|uniref:hypothetical protein n=1 Tax=Halalkalibacter urbisdiaboli TaxID=1960589 RepID=UPI000B4538A5|nr:hypothetical protein [Halalkalibacter urbisdiaboli]